jgi:hypothetical protein
MPDLETPLQLCRFTLTDGRELRLYCRLAEVRETPFLTCRLYEDHRGGRWLEVDAGGEAALLPLGEETFAQRVAAELNTLGLNKYSG